MDHVLRAPRHQSNSSEWERVFASHISDKGLITRIHRKLKNLNSQEIINPMNKWAKKLKRQFAKEEVQTANKYMKKCSASLAIN
jgi:hypothetical protein